MRLKTLNGAPLSEHLDFADDNLLKVNAGSTFFTASPRAAVESTPLLKWWSLAKGDTRLRTGWSQPYLPGSGLHRDESHLSVVLPDIQSSRYIPKDDSTNLDTTVTFDGVSTEPADYLQHSLIFHDTLLSSQVLPDERTDNATTLGSSSFQTTSFGTTASELSSPNGANEHTMILQIQAKMTVTPLGSLPSAQHLRRIYPQTPTPNFICVSTANPEQREVFVRKGGYKMNLWEVTVADDTRSGFKISFWVRPPRESNNEQTRTQNLFLRTLERIETGDILLLRNIALTSFRDNVFGQSLNPAITRARTTVDIMTRSNGVSIGQVSALSPPLLETFMRVKKWAKSHVATDNKGPRKRKASAANADTQGKRTFATRDLDDSMPPDTMESV